MIFYSFFAALATAGDLIYEKYLFSVSRLKDRQKIFVTVMFIFAALFLSVFVLIFPSFWEVKAQATESLFVLLMVAVVAIACVRNLLYYYSFQREGLCQIEPFMSFSPLLTVLLAGMIYPNETNGTVFILAIIAAIALVFSKIEKKHLTIDKALIPIVAVVFLEALENNLTRELLRFYSPVSMYMIRCFFIAISLLIFVRPKIGKLYIKEVGSLLAISFLWVLVMVAVYYSYQSVGVVYTSLVLMLSPILIVLGSKFILKEKGVSKKNIIALVIVLACVVLAQFAR